MQKKLRGTSGVGLVALAALGACDAQVEPEYPGEPLVTLKGRVEALSASPPEADIGVLWFESDAASGCSGPVRSGIATATGTFSGDTDYACTSACGVFPLLDLDDGGDVAQQAVANWESCQRACGVDVTAELFVSYQACVTGAVGQTAPVVGEFPAQFSLDMLLPPPAAALMPSDTGERVALGYFVALAPHSGSLAISFEREAPAWLMGGSPTHVLAYAADPIDASSSWGRYFGAGFDVGYHLLGVHFGTRCGLPDFEEDYGPFESGGDEDGAESGDLMPMPDTEPLAAPMGESSSQPYVEGADAEPIPLPDYRNETFVCGNGICEAGEDCRHCSDCGGCEGGAPGQSTGVLYGQAGYSCNSTPSVLEEAAPGSEVDIQLLLAPPQLIDWPTL